MGKPFSEMTPLEQHVNRRRMRAGFDAGWTEEIGVRDLAGREGDVVSAAILDHVQRVQRATDSARQNESALNGTLKRLGLDR